VFGFSPKPVAPARRGASLTLSFLLVVHLFTVLGRDGCDRCWILL